MVEQTEIDGVPVFFADEPGPLTAGLVFRVGQADERLTERGLTHLVEHLALGPVVPDHRASNGTVAMTTTWFETKGEPDEVVAFFTALIASLDALPYDRLDVERRVLRTEGQRGGASLSALAHSLRFGPRAYGTVDFPELGLHGTDRDRIEAWRRRWFTRANAALWLSGPPPEGLRLDGLPDGERMAAPPAEPVAYRYPAWYPASDKHVAVSLLGERSTALWVAHGILYERLYERLRATEGRTYEVSVDYERLNADHAAILVVTDTLPEEAAAVRDAVSVELGRLARGGATDEELAELVELLGKHRGQPGSAAAQAEGWAVQALRGEELRTDEQLDAEVAALSGADVGAALRAAAGTALWLVPGRTGMYDQRVREVPVSLHPDVTGTTYARPQRIAEDLAGDTLIVGDEGLTIATPDRPGLTVRFDRCAAVQHFDDGARRLFGDDSLRIFLHPGEWERGEEAIAAVDAAMDPALVVAMGEDSGYEPPLREGEPEPAGAGGLLSRFRRR